MKKDTVVAVASALLLFVCTSIDLNVISSPVLRLAIVVSGVASALSLIALLAVWFTMFFEFPPPTHEDDLSTNQKKRGAHLRLVKR